MITNKKQPMTFLQGCCHVKPMSFSGFLDSKAGKSKLKIALPSMNQYKSDTLTALRDLGRKK